jgi:hypothetical protein
MITGLIPNPYRERMPFLSGPILKVSLMKNQGSWKCTSTGLKAWNLSPFFAENILCGPFGFIVVTAIKAMILFGLEKKEKSKAGGSVFLLNNCAAIGVYYF